MRKLNLKEKIQKELKKAKNQLIDQVYLVITPENQEWEIIRQLQESQILPIGLRQVFVYKVPRQYERNVMEMEGYKILDVKLYKVPFAWISPWYKEFIRHNTCYNPYQGRLHVFLQEYQSLDDLPYILQKKEDIFIPPIFKQ